MEYGSDAHKELFCRFFIDTHKPFKPDELHWPELSEETIQKLAKFPIWDHAVFTERQVSNKLNAYAEEITDPLLKEAMALQGYEEGRHADLLKYFLNRYNIPFEEKPDNPLSDDLEMSFLRTGAGECIDSFFAFGFLEISKSSKDYPLELIEVMEPIVQEEARHILFIANWILYQRYQQPALLQPLHSFKTLLSFWNAGWSRLMDLKNLGGEAFTIQARKQENSSMGAKDFIQLCLRENKRRLNEYDPLLARPKLIPRLMSGVSFLF